MPRRESLRDRESQLQSEHRIQGSHRHETSMRLPTPRAISDHSNPYNVDEGDDDDEDDVYTRPSRAPSSFNVRYQSATPEPTDSRRRSYTSNTSTFEMRMPDQNMNSFSQEASRPSIALLSTRMAPGNASDGNLNNISNEGAPTSFGRHSILNTTIPEAAFGIGVGAQVSKAIHDSRRVPPDSLLVSNVLSELTPGTAAFYQIPFGDFAACLAFVAGQPDVLQERRERLQTAVMTLYARGQDVPADQIVDRLAILYHCQKERLSLEGALRYISRLNTRGPRGKQLEKHLDTFNKIRTHLQKAAASHVAYDHPPRPVDSFTTASNIEDEAYSAVSTGNADLPISMMSPPTIFTQSTPRERSWNQPRNENPAIAQPYSTLPASNAARYRDHLSEHNLTQNFQKVMDLDPQRRTQQLSSGLQIFPDSYVPTPPNPRFIPGANNPNLSSTDAEQQPYSHQGETGRDESSLSRMRLGADYQAKNTMSSDQYEPRLSDAKNFFSRGRVFRMWWHETAGRVPPHEQDHKISRGPDGQMIYSKLIWMVVIHNKKGYCICCPISTYNERGLTKPGFDERERRAHAIIYSEGQHPVRLRAEPPTSKEPIEVKMKSGIDPIHKAARVHFGKVHTINWDCAIMDMGRVVAEQRERLTEYCAEEQRFRH